MTDSDQKLAREEINNNIRRSRLNELLWLLIEHRLGVDQTIDMIMEVFEDAGDGND